ncbi:unnamed protein product, partial [Gongylonema pulchrum]|uniref:RalBP1-associated Eps domain-containing protein 2 n=1 Tax=Gongylonema pulchrum TaxID=637853 RepID=A0A183E0Z5_9BILA
STTNSARSNPEASSATYSQWNVPEYQHAQPANPSGYSYFENPLQTSASRQASFVSQNPANYQALRPALWPVNNPVPFPFALREYATNYLPGSYDSQAIQDYPKSETESSAHPKKANALQFPEQDPQVHSSVPDDPVQSNSLLRTTLQRPLEAQSPQSKVQRNLLDSAAFAAWKKLTSASFNKEVSDSQREQPNYWPADATQVQDTWRYSPAQQPGSRGCISPEWTPETARYLDSLLSANWEETDDSSGSGRLPGLSVEPLLFTFNNWPFLTVVDSIRFLSSSAFQCAKETLCIVWELPDAARKVLNEQ